MSIREISIKTTSYTFRKSTGKYWKKRTILRRNSKYINNSSQFIRNEYLKSKLNFSFLIKITKGQDETSEENGPQNHIDDAILVDKSEIDLLNNDINKNYTIKVIIVIYARNSIWIKSRITSKLKIF